jgi:hypothetical protein
VAMCATAASRLPKARMAPVKPVRVGRRGAELKRDGGTAKGFGSRNWGGALASFCGWVAGGEGDRSAKVAVEALVECAVCGEGGCEWDDLGELAR